MHKRKSRAYLFWLLAIAVIFVIWFYFTIINGSNDSIQGLLVKLL